jgi:hypothetical protein
MKSGQSSLFAAVADFNEEVTQRLIRNFTFFSPEGAVGLVL